ncbi:MFS transporter [Amycolatopsis eburnea]|uniref:MFS transporter n=1 Tax=Amycolatopsis eburnea TaxID=2267691 RepID=UPI001CDBE690|nr:MFS transporter [Amycolatopsis eburnea]
MPITTYRLRWAALAVLLTAEAMNLLDATIVQVAGPAIPAPAAAVPWFTAAYTLPFAAFLITGGRLGDVFGRAKVFKIGVAGFVLASVACAAAQNAGVLIGARAAQGAAAALVIPQTIGLIRALFDGAELAKALGTIGPVMGLSAVTGPLLGGLLTEAVSWRAAFLVNVPLGLTVFFAARLLHEDGATAGPRVDQAALAGAGPGGVQAARPRVGPAAAGSCEERPAARPQLDPAGTSVAGAGLRGERAAAWPQIDSAGAGSCEVRAVARPQLDLAGTSVAGAGLRGERAAAWPQIDSAGAGSCEDRPAARPQPDPAGTALAAATGSCEDQAAARPQPDPALPGARSPEEQARPRIDPIGTALVVAGTALLVYPLLDPAGPDWRLLAAGAAALVAFGFHQRRSAAPLVEPSLFTHRGFPAALAGSLLFFAAMTGLMQVVPMQLQLGLGADVRTAGLTLLPLSAGLAVSSWFAGARLVPRFGARVMFGGLALLLLGILAAVAVYASVPGYPWPLPVALALCGLGMGTFTVPFFTAALARVRPHETGSAAGLLNAVQQLGGTLGVALLGGLYLGSGTATAPLGLGAGLVVAAAAAVVPLSSRRGR